MWRHVPRNEHKQLLSNIVTGIKKGPSFAKHDREWEVFAQKMQLYLDKNYAFTSENELVDFVASEITSTPKRKSEHLYQVPAKRRRKVGEHDVDTERYSIQDTLIKSPAESDAPEGFVPRQKVVDYLDRMSMINAISEACQFAYTGKLNHIPPDFSPDPNFIRGNMGVLVNNTDKVAIVYYRGTADSRDILADVSVLFSTQRIAHFYGEDTFKDAVEFFDQVKQQYPDYYMGVGGHSLGGTKADYVNEQRTDDIGICLTINKGSGLFAPIAERVHGKNPDNQVDYRTTGDIVSFTSQWTPGERITEGEFDLYMQDMPVKLAGFGEVVGGPAGAELGAVLGESISMGERAKKSLEVHGIAAALDTFEFQPTYKDETVVYPNKSSIIHKAMPGYTQRRDSMIEPIETPGAQRYVTDAHISPVENAKRVETV